MFANDVNHFDLGVAKEFEMIDSVPRVIVEDEFEDDLDWRDDEGWEDIVFEVGKEIVERRGRGRNL